MALKDFLDSLNDGEDYSIFPIVYEELLRQESLPSSRATGTWHPSEMHDFCPMRGVASYLRKDLWDKEPFSPKDLENFRKGTALHEMYQQGILGPAEVLYGKWRCSRCDALSHMAQSKYFLDAGTRVTGRKAKKAKGNKRIITLAEGGTCEFHPVITIPTEPCALCAHIPDGTIGNILMQRHRCKMFCGHGVNNEVKNEKTTKARGGCNHCGVWGKWDYEEVSAKDEELNITGHVDGIIKTRDGIPRVLELKSANVFALKSYKEKPHERHVTQAQVYMHCLDMEEANITYFNKDFSKNEEHIVKIDPKYLKGIFGLVKETNAFLNDVGAATSIQTLPKAKDLKRICEKKKDGVKRRCPYVDGCFDKEDVMERVKAQIKNKKR